MIYFIIEGVGLSLPATGYDCGQENAVFVHSPRKVLEYHKRQPRAFRPMGWRFVR